MGNGYKRESRQLFERKRRELHTRRSEGVLSGCATTNAWFFLEFLELRLFACVHRMLRATLLNLNQVDALSPSRWIF